MKALEEKSGFKDKGFNRLKRKVQMVAVFFFTFAPW
jgi:hypothetical protein